MDKVQVSNGRVEHALIRGAADALNDASTNHAVVVGTNVGRPEARGDDKHQTDDESMAFAPNTTRRNEDDGSSSGAEEEVASQDDSLGQANMEDKRAERDGVGGEDGAERGRKDTAPAENKGDQVAFADGPVERIVGVIGRLGSLQQIKFG